MWSGSTVPTGWYLYNGQNGTPDLRNRFIVGAGSNYTIGNTGGSSTVTLTTAQIPNHTHTLDIYEEGYGTHPTTRDTLRTYEGESVFYGETSGGDWNSASYDILSKVGGGGAHENRPPYYALAFIMKA